MIPTIRIPVEGDLYEQARLASAVDNRAVSGQIEHWARVGRAAFENAALPASFIAEALPSLGEPRSDAMPFVPRTPNQRT